MNLKSFAPGVVVAAAAIALSGCAANENASPAATTSNLTGTLNGIGSSAQGTAQKTWIAGFQSANPGVTINYDPQGSGAGRTSFISGAADFAGSDAALKAAELSGDFAACAAGTKAIDIPVYISPIAIAYNLDGVKELKLDPEAIAGIFSGAITNWTDPKLSALNPGVALPSAPITVVHRSDDSGTTQNFTEYLAVNAPTVWVKDGKLAEPSQTFPFQVGDAAKGTSGVATATANAKNSITYIDESGAAGLSIAQLKVGDEFTTISAKGAAEVVAKSPLVTGRGANDLAINIDRADTTAGAWPLVLVSYLIACEQYKDSAKGELVKEYASYLVGTDAQDASAEQAGSAPLTSDLAQKASQAIANIK